MFSRKSLHILYEFETVHTDKGTGNSVVNSFLVGYILILD